MEKRISYSQFQQVKNAAKMIDPNMRKIEALKKKIMPLVEEMKGYQTQVDALEEGIVKVIGFHVADLVKKVIEPTGKTDPKTGKPLTITKYLPTDIVAYDEQKKQYVITVPDAEQPVPQTDAPKLEINEEASEREAAEAEASQMPWENQ